MRTSIIALAVLLAAGCASTSEDSGATGSSDMVCTRERSTGSYVAQRVCRTRGDAQADREAARRSMETQRTVNTTGG